MRLSRFSTTPDKPATIDLTPMLDVVFIMLIFFIVTANFVKEVGVAVNPPEPSQQPAPPNPENVLVTISARDRYEVAGTPVDVRLLGAQFARLYARNPGSKVAVRAHQASSTQALVRVLDEARLSGLDVALAR